jgi:hypothetical protein
LPISWDWEVSKEDGGWRRRMEDERMRGWRTEDGGWRMEAERIKREKR